MRTPRHATETTARKRGRSPSPSCSPSRSPSFSSTSPASECAETTPSALHGLSRTHALVVRSDFDRDPSALYAYLVTRQLPARVAASEGAGGVAVDCHWAVPYGAAGYLPAVEESRHRSGTAASARPAVGERRSHREPTDRPASCAMALTQGEDDNSAVWAVPPGWGLVTHSGKCLFLDHVAREAHEENPFIHR